MRGRFAYVSGFQKTDASECDWDMGAVLLTLMPMIRSVQPRRKMLSRALPPLREVREYTVIATKLFELIHCFPVNASP